ncbi:MAG: DUF262 domain-containing protein [Candidatus Methylacidiphilales bacterium]|nr:DUF262 domain-containing HNH endonuclease family protein [Candidatus Methylacidiphilales bacterium]
MALGALLATSTKDLKEVLSNGKTYTVPQYQRDYSWRVEHWEDLWEDLQAIESSGEDHYMGSIVLEVRERKQFRIIDGQQRIATLSILIIACVNYLRSLVSDEKNAERAAELERTYLGTKDPASLRITPKLKLNLNDDSFFQLNIAQHIQPSNIRGLRSSEKLLWDCFNFFKSKIQKKFAGPGAGVEVSRFVNELLTERLGFITVEVQDQLSAYTVFETLNARGIELTETDLLKNYLLSLADRLSASQMDPILKLWARITDRIGASAFPEFLRHHVNSKREYIRQKQLFKIIKSDVTDMPQVFKLLEALDKDAAWFSALSSHSDDFWLDYPGAKEHVRALNLFNVSQYTPLILAAKDSFTKPQDLVEVLRYCAVISVRFNGVSRRSTHILEEVYNSVALQIRNGKINNLQLLRHSLKPIYIPDDEFEADFSTMRLKFGGNSGKRIRYFLAKLEKQFGGADIHDDGMQATIEHILPENPDSTAWQSFSPEAHERSVVRLGNYTLLERDLNGQQAGNAGFSVKQGVYDKSKYTLTKKLGAYADWTEDSINTRQKELARIAKTVWSLSV